MSETDIDYSIRALLGSIMIIAIMVCSVYLCYKLAVCREEEEKKNNFKMASRTRNKIVNITPGERDSILK